MHSESEPNTERSNAYNVCCRSLFFSIISSLLNTCTFYPSYIELHNHLRQRTLQLEPSSLLGRSESMGDTKSIQIWIPTPNCMGYSLDRPTDKLTNLHTKFHENLCITVQGPPLFIWGAHILGSDLWPWLNVGCEQNMKGAFHTAGVTVQQKCLFIVQRVPGVSW